MRNLIFISLILCFCGTVKATVTTTTSSTSFAGNGKTVAFPYTFPTTAASELVVKVTVDATGVTTTKTLTTHYSTTVGSGGGTLTMVTPPAAGETLTIERVTPKTQLLSLTVGGTFNPILIVASLDKLTKMAIELFNSSQRALRAPAVETTLDMELPSAVDRAGYYLAFDANGEPIASAGTGTDPAASAYISTLLDDANSTAARATLELGTAAVADINDVAGNGDTTEIWSADKAYDELAGKEDTDPNLTGIAGTDPNAGDVWYKPTTSTFSSFPTTGFGRGLLNDANAPELAASIEQDAYRNVLWYDPAGDLLEDDSTELQAAINSLGWKRGLYLPRPASSIGYRIDTPLSIGPGNSVKYGLDFVGVGHPKITWGGSGDDTMLDMLCISESTIRNLWFDANSIADMNGIYVGTLGASKSAQHVTFDHVTVQNAPASGIIIFQQVDATNDYYSFNQCNLNGNGTGLVLAGGGRQINWYGGSILNSTTYGTDIAAGEICDFGGFYAGSGTADIYVGNVLSGFQLYGTKTESPQIIATDPAAISHVDRLTANIMMGVQQDQQPLASTTAVDYDANQPLLIIGSKFQGNVVIGPNVPYVTEFGNQFEAGAFTGETSKLKLITHGQFRAQDVDSEEATIMFMHGSHYSVLRSYTDQAGKLPVYLQQQDSTGTTTPAGLDANGDWFLTGFQRGSVTNNITAASPGVQGDVPLTTEYNIVTVVGTNGDAVTAPAAIAGRPFTVWNDDAAQTLEIWPASGDDLGAGVNTAIALVANDHITCVAIDGTTWKVK